MKKLFLLVLPALCVAADSPSGIDTLIAEARTIPPEFAANALLRLAGVAGLEQPRRVELFVEAFDRAAGAQQPLKRRATPSRLEGPAGFLNRAYSQDLDALSLRLRAVDGLLPLDAVQAEALFLKIPPLELAPSTCDGFLVYDVTQFYDVLGRLAIHSADPAKLLGRYSAVTSAAQVASVAHLLATAGLNDASLGTLAAGFAKDMGKIKGDDRTFTFYRSAGHQVLELSKAMARRKMPPKTLLESYRLYLVNHLSGARCSDNDLMQGTPQNFGMPADTIDRETASLVKFFNDSMRVPPLQPIDRGEMIPTRQEGAAIGLRWCEDGTCQEIAEQIRGLTFGPDNTPYLPADKGKPEWQEKLRKVLVSIEEWKPAEGDAARQFREKSGAYLEALGLVMTSVDRATVLRGLLSFLARNPLQAESRIDWFLPVNGLIGRAAMDPVGLAPLVEELRQSNDPVISLFARLEQLAPRTAGEILPLL